MKFKTIQKPAQQSKFTPTLRVSAVCWLEVGSFIVDKTGGVQASEPSSACRMAMCAESQRSSELTNILPDIQGLAKFG